MHFRHFLISGLMVGAALFLPDQAFAEKNELRDQGQKSEKVLVEKAVIPVQTQESSVPSQQKQNNSMAVPQSEPKEQSFIPAPSQKALENTAATLEKIPDQAKGNEKAAARSVEKVTGLEKAASVKGNPKKIDQKKQAPKKSADNAGSNFLHSKSQTPSVSSTEKVKIEDTRSTLSNEKESQKEREIPVRERELPKANQTTNQTQRTSNAGGKSNDRTNYGLNNMTMFDKLLEWHHVDEPILVQIYFSRQDFMIHQWVNAPPSPPPQTAPFFKNVTRS